ncbi:type 1 fimbrial protein [Enterobacteriaceae bacterium G50]|nr:type 1 fimbrial protein [Enterobacteriaceae bacterium G50]
MNNRLPHSFFTGLIFCCLPGLALAQGTLNLTGSITNTTCALSQESQDILVTLGSASLKQFTVKGATAQAKDFAIKLEDCGKGVTTVRVSFSGTPDNDDASVIALDAGGASGVGVQILDANMNPIKLTEASLPYPLEASPAEVTLKFNARYIATRLPITTGIANASGTFVFHYD